MFFAFTHNIGRRIPQKKVATVSRLECGGAMWRPAKPFTLIRRFWQSGDRENLFGAVWRSVAESGDRENLLSLKRPFRESGDRANLLGLATFHWETGTTFSPARGGPIQVLGERGNLLSLKSRKNPLGDRENLLLFSLPLGDRGNLFSQAPHQGEAGWKKR